MYLQTAILVWPCLLQAISAIKATPTAASPDNTIASVITMMPSIGDSRSIQQASCWTHTRRVWDATCPYPKVHCPKMQDPITWESVPGPLDSCPTTQTLSLSIKCPGMCNPGGPRISYMHTYASFSDSCYTATKFHTEFERPRDGQCRMLKCAVSTYYTLVPPRMRSCPTTAVVTKTTQVADCTACPTETSTFTENPSATG